VLPEIHSGSFVGLLHQPGAFCSLLLAESKVEWREFLSWLAQTAQKHHDNLIVALDEIGARPIPNASDFFMVIRDIYNSRQSEPEFFHLSFLLVGSFHPRDLITDDKVSPFNIARRVRLDDFTKEQIYHLAKKPNWSEEKTKEIIERCSVAIMVEIW
jgi:hypothetical protein